jgi:hypothetical protein
LTGVDYIDILEEEHARWQRRDAKVRKRRKAMIVDGRSLVTTILPILGERAKRLEIRDEEDTIPG